MVGRKRGDIPKSLVRGRERFEVWRRSRKVGARIPTAPLNGGRQEPHDRSSPQIDVWCDDREIEGRPRHAGKNLSHVLQHRAEQLEAPVQMCDGLARNLPKGLDTILANCLAHGRRNFVELYDRFPEECRHVIEAFKVI